MQDNKEQVKDSPNAVVDHFFRHEYGKVVSYLTKKFGTSYIEQIEDAVQEALYKAMNNWAFNPVPDNPSGWIVRVANNYLIDTLRRDKKIQPKDEETLYMNMESSEDNPANVVLDDELQDGQLKMMFACCHPTLSPDSQIMLTLKLLAGFSNKEVAKSLLKKEEAVAKALTRAKQKMKEEVGSIDVPASGELKDRLESVLKVIYLLFNEGYSATTGEQVIKKDICFEAIRLCKMLAENKYFNAPSVNALMALMCFHASRFDAREDENGDIITLENQDRTIWNQQLIQLGFYYLTKASDNEDEVSDYHIQAGIAYNHCIAPTFEQTNWENILNLYNLQVATNLSPVIALNRLVALSKVKGAKQALTELQNLEDHKYLQEYHLLYAIKAELLVEVGDITNAKQAFEKAKSLTSNLKEVIHINKRLQSLKR